VQDRRVGERQTAFSHAPQEVPLGDHLNISSRPFRLLITGHRIDWIATLTDPMSLFVSEPSYASLRRQTGGSGRNENSGTACFDGLFAGERITATRVPKPENQGVPLIGQPILCCYHRGSSISAYLRHAIQSAQRDFPDP
jgi:hypothetical protein